MLSGSALMVTAKLGSWLALVSIGLLQVFGMAIRPGMTLACVLVAAPIALAASVRAIVSTWRGPPVITFELDEAVRCRPAEAGVIRGHAQLRGTMGGAGHVYPARLAFPIGAWLSALAAGAEALVPGAFETVGSWPSVVALAAAFMAWLLPSRPFWYREVTGGGILVRPPIAAALIVAIGGRASAEAHAAERDA